MSSSSGRCPPAPPSPAPPTPSLSASVSLTLSVNHAHPFCHLLSAPHSLSLSRSATPTLSISLTLSLCQPQTLSVGHAYPLCQPRALPALYLRRLQERVGKGVVAHTEGSCGAHSAFVPWSLQPTPFLPNMERGRPGRRRQALCRLSGDITPCVKSHRSSYTGLYPQSCIPRVSGLSRVPGCFGGFRVSSGVFGCLREYQAHRLLDHSTLGLRVIKREEESTRPKSASLITS